MYTHAHTYITVPSAGWFVNDRHAILKVPEAEKSYWKVLAVSVNLEGHKHAAATVSNDLAKLEGNCCVDGRDQDLPTFSTVEI